MRFFLDIAHRAGCLAILVVAMAPLVIALGKPERPILAVAFGCALLAGAIGGAIWSMHIVSPPHRREGRGLVIVAVIVLCLTAILMGSAGLRQHLANIGNSVLAPLERQGYPQSP